VASEMAVRSLPASSTLCAAVRRAGRERMRTAISHGMGRFSSTPEHDSAGMGTTGTP